LSEALKAREAEHEKVLREALEAKDAEHAKALRDAVAKALRDARAAKDQEQAAVVRAEVPQVVPKTVPQVVPQAEAPQVKQAGVTNENDEAEAAEMGRVAAGAATAWKRLEAAKVWDGHLRFKRGTCYGEIMLMDDGQGSGISGHEVQQLVSTQEELTLDSKLQLSSIPTEGRAAPRWAFFFAKDHVVAGGSAGGSGGGSGGGDTVGKISDYIRQKRKLLGLKLDQHAGGARCCFLPPSLLHMFEAEECTPGHKEMKEQVECRLAQLKDTNAQLPQLVVLIQYESAVAS
jgi:hypothetical protein